MTVSVRNTESKGWFLGGFRLKGKITAWDVRFYGSILLGVAVFGGVVIYRIVRSFDRAGAAITVTVFPLTVLLIVGLLKNGRRRHRKRSLRGTEGALWASRLGTAVTSPGTTAAEPDAAGKGVAIIGGRGMNFAAAPREGQSSALPWANVRTIECRFGQGWRSERGLSITMADGGEVLLRVPVDEATLTALTSCGARLERET